MKTNLLLWLLFSCVASASERAQMVSMTQLMSNPEKYIDKKIHVKGYFEVGVSTDLYFSKEHALEMDYTSSFSVEDRSEGKLKISRCNGQWVDIQAKFTYRHGSFMLRDVEFIRGRSGELCEVQ